MAQKYVVPSVRAKSFSCPHCGALADQSWFSVYADSNDGPPELVDQNTLSDLRSKVSAEGRETQELWEKWWPEFERRALGGPFLHREQKGRYLAHEVANVFVSSCFSCKAIAVWRYDTLLFPATRHEVEPNPDLNADIRADFEEARAVFSSSPRASAALLRLCIQKLCIQLGEPGKKLDDDIAALVKRGLPSTIQKALDLVRVIGNNAVHPGAINLNDDKETAAKLFELVNLTADNLISQPNAIAKLFDEKIPPGAKTAISKRDTK